MDADVEFFTFNVKRSSVTHIPLRISVAEHLNFWTKTANSSGWCRNNDDFESAEWTMYFINVCWCCKDIARMQYLCMVFRKRSIETESYSRQSLKISALLLVCPRRRGTFFHFLYGTFFYFLCCGIFQQGAK